VLVKCSLESTVAFARVTPRAKLSGLDTLPLRRIVFFVDPIVVQDSMMSSLSQDARLR